MRSLGFPLAAVLAFAAARAGASESRTDRVGWWIEHYGVIEAQERPGLDAAWSIFDRVRAVADKNGKRFPRLVMLRDRQGPFALALPDGTVLLTPDAVALCYAGAPRAVGDGRLAFVLGHELAHLARDDFWHAFAPGSRGSNVEPRARAIEKERQADAYGLLYMVMAGYAPGSVLRQNASFLDEWERAAGAHPVREGQSHPSNRERARNVRASMQALEDEMDLFRAGVRLMQLERYADALKFLQRFQETLPSREVFNNVGVCNLQLYLRDLGASDPEQALRFRLPVTLDPASRLRRVNPRGEQVACPAAARQQLEEAERRLEHAVASDPTYAKASLNLASVRILSGDHARALAAAEDALKADPGSVEAQATKAIAMYLYDAKELATRAVQILRDLRARQPANAGVAYNLAVLLDEQQRPSAAREAWEQFLGLEPEGWYAARAHRQLGHTAPQPPSRRIEARPALVPLGEIRGEVERSLKDLKARRFDLGDETAVLYRGEGLSAIAIDAWIEVVEEEMSPEPLAQLLASYGPPPRQVDTNGGRTLVYDGQAFDVEDGKAVRRILFATTH